MVSRRHEVTVTVNRDLNAGMAKLLLYICGTYSVTEEDAGK